MLLISGMFSVVEYFLWVYIDLSVRRFAEAV